MEIAEGEMKFKTLGLGPIGVGGFGKVYLVQKIGGEDNGIHYAKKQIMIHNIFGREMAILQMVRDTPFLDTLHYFFRTPETFNIVLEYHPGGNLRDLVRSRKVLREDEAQPYVGEIILGTENLHKLGIVHKDLKMDNIVLDRDGHIVIVDFGVSEVIADTDKKTFSWRRLLKPTLSSHQGSEVDFARDWWSIGLITFHMIYNGLPENQGKRELSVLPKEVFSPDAEDFVNKLLVGNMGCGERGYEEIKEHPFLRSIDWADLANKKVKMPFFPNEHTATNIIA